MAKKSLSATVTVIIPAYNEEENIADAVTSARTACESATVSYRLLIIDDGSTDTTAKRSEQLVKKIPSLTVIRHPVNQGLGASFRTALAHVSTPYLTVFPGDNDMAAASLLQLIQQRDTADLIFSYPENTHKRGGIRRLLSGGYIMLMNILFGLSIRYYNGPFLCKTQLLQRIQTISNGLDVFAEIKVRLLVKRISYREIPFIHTGRHHGVSKAVNMRSILQTLRTTGYLLRDIYL